MNTEQLITVVNQYGLTLDTSAAELLNAISRLPTSDIIKLFNEIAVIDTFHNETELELF